MLEETNILNIAKKLSIVGAPSSAGSYGPGQEKAPDALRSAGLLNYLSDLGIEVNDLGNVSGFRWSVDHKNPLAMNAKVVCKIAKEVAVKVSSAISESDPVLVIGGDCTVELGTVAGVLSENSNIGLVYIDLDTDLNTPKSTNDGALDWMGVAHMLGVENTESNLVDLGPRTPLLQPDQILFFGVDNVKPFERNIIEEKNIEEIPLKDVILDPQNAALKVVDWSQKFEYILIHLDVDVLDYLDMPIAENYRRNTGLTFKQLTESLTVLLDNTNWITFTITEVNPDHAESDGSTLQLFSKSIGEIISNSRRFNPR